MKFMNMSQSETKSWCFILMISAYYNILLFAQFVFVKMNSICLYMYMCSFVSECFILHCTNLYIFSEVCGNKLDFEFIISTSEQMCMQLFVCQEHC